MDAFLTLMPLQSLVLCLVITLIAGVVKGVVGFAMPMIMISGMSSVIAPDLALAGLILPTLVTNSMQALRQGPRAAVGSVKRFGLFLGVGLVTLLISAQLVTVLPVGVMLALIGLPVAAFACAQLLGWRGELPGGPSLKLEVGIGAFAGFMGGLSGVWGPPVVAYLTAIGTEKREQMRIQGVIYGLGALALTAAHLGSGVLNARSVWLSLLLIPPAVAGMWIGGHIQDRIDQTMFRRATLVVLLVAGLNLCRRALMG